MNVQFESSIGYFYMNSLISELKSSEEVGVWVKEAEGQLPNFLKCNLQNQARTIKMFKQEYESYLRIFVWQLLRNCVEIEDLSESTSSLDKLMDLVEKNVEKLWLSQKYSDHRLQSKSIKELMFEFLEICSEGEEAIDTLLNRYPIAEDSLICFTQGLIEGASGFEGASGIIKVSAQEPWLRGLSTLRWLCHKFSIDSTEYDQCFQFSQTETYIYFKDIEHLYLIYIDPNRIKDNQSDSIAADSKLSDSSLQKTVNKSQQKLLLPVKKMVTFNESDILFNEQPEHKPSDIAEISEDNQCIDNSLTNIEKSNEKLRYKFMSQLSTNYETYGETRNQRVLNLSSELTNSFILQYVQQPYKSRIEGLKSRVRNQKKARKSIAPFFH